MRVLILQGNHYDMGYQHGQQVVDLHPQIIKAIDQRLADWTSSDPREAWIAEVEEAWVRQASSTLNMIRGMAQALGLSFSVLFEYALASYLDDRSSASRRAEGCTVWAASGRATIGGEPILTKNRDYNLGHLALQMLAYAKPQEGYTYQYVTSAGSPAVFSSGMNQAGLAIADTHVPSIDLGPGLARYTLMMQILEKYDCVSSALRYLRDVPLMGGGNLVLADAQGEMAAVETGYRRRGVITPVDHFVVATNHFISPGLRDAYLEPQAQEGDDQSESRRETIRRTLVENWGTVDENKARQMMAIHTGHGSAICRHNLENNNGTISNVILLPAQHRLLFCNGRPCESHYTTHVL